MKKNIIIYLVILISITGIILASCSKKEGLIGLQENETVTDGSRLKSLPAFNDNRVAYYAFDATPVNQDKLRLTDFTDNANIIVVFEGTLWELADSAHYGSSSSYIVTINGGPYRAYSQILNDIQTLRQRGVKVLMNVDDAASWSTSTPFTTWNGTHYNYQQFAAFVYNCVIAAGFDGISLDVEHGATDNTYYRNLITELGSYFGPLSSNPATMIYTGAFYSGGAPGPIFREPALSQYLNFVMDMAYFQNNTTRFNYWANTLGNSKVMIGMSHEYNSESSAIAHAQWHPTPDKAGIMVFAGNVNKAYTDNILAALGSGCTPTILTPYVNVNNGGWQQTNTATLDAGGTVVLGPGPNSGTWSWTGPNNYSASVREITLSNIQTNQGGTYVATNTNTCGSQSNVSFNITVNGGTGGGLNGNYRIVNRNSGKCLIPLNGSTANATDIVQYTIRNYNYEVWNVTEISSGVYNIIHVTSGKYADIYGASKNAGAHNIIWPSNGGNNQKWNIVDQGGGYYHIVNVNSGLFLDINSASTANNALNIQETNDGGNNQDWSFVAAN